MRKILLVLKREYLTRIRKRSFIIATLLVPLGFLLLFMAEIALVTYSSTGTTRIVVKDETGLFGHRFKDTNNFYFKKSDDSLHLLQQHYQEADFDGILHIPPMKIDNPKKITYFSDQSLGISGKSYIQKQIKKEIKRLKIKEYGIDSRSFGRLERLEINIEEAGATGTDVASTGIATGIGYFMGMLMYFVIFIYGSIVMRSVMEEKTNRIVEVILSSIKPFQLMMGKILGVGLMGVTQFVIWIVLLLVINVCATIFISTTVDFSSMQSMAMDEQGAEQTLEIWQSIQTQLGQLPIGLLVGCLLFYFVGGYLLYAALFAGLAAAVNDESDAQTLTIPISIPIVLAIFILMAILGNPNSNLAVWSSLFPFFSPIIMPARIAFGVPTWQLLTSMGLLVLGFLITLWIAARIYRVGILMYGKKISFKEIGRWLFYSN